MYFEGLVINGCSFVFSENYKEYYAAKYKGVLGRIIFVHFQFREFPSSFYISIWVNICACMEQTEKYQMARVVNISNIRPMKHIISLQRRHFSQFIGIAVDKEWFSYILMNIYVRCQRYGKMKTRTCNVKNPLSLCIVKYFVWFWMLS